jgi:excisionase family DNA binding protein
MAIDTEARQDLADPAEFAQAAQAALSSGEPLTVSIGGAVCTVLPATAAAILAFLQIREGAAMQVSVVGGEMTTGQAADYLKVSRPTVVEWVDSGQLAARRVGTHRRIQSADVVAFAEQRRISRRSALDELTAESEAAGLYDLDA